MSIDPLYKALMKGKLTSTSLDPRIEEFVKEYPEKQLQAELRRSPYIYYEDTSSTVTSSLTSPILYGRCVVCNKPSNLKCSPCASNGTQWMYFCGQDHQKLIWPLHKRVCGKRSTPWSWPPLTKKELQEMVELSVVPCRNQEKGVVSTWSEIFEQTMRIHAPRLFALSTPGEFPRFFASLLAKKLEPADGSPLDPDQHGSGIVGYRSDAWRTLGTSSQYLERDPEFEEMMDLLVKYPFNFLANFEDCQIQELAFNSKFSWWSDLQHHIVIMLSLVSLCWQRGILTVDYTMTEYQKLEAYRQHAYEETMKYCREVIKPIDPEMAKKLAWKLITPLVRHHSQMNPSGSCPTM
ncbi:hypothetical protein JCM5353_003775 [Sporobolomyces roseus]